MQFAVLGHVTSVLIHPDLDVPESEFLLVRRWRREQFDSLGFDAADARLLAESTADLGLARGLAAADCPPDLAFRILA